MATPKRAQIRNAVVSTLINQTDANANVYPNRVSAFWRSELPSISVFIRDEDLTPRDLGNRSYLRKATLIIDVHAEGNESLDETLDSISEKIEELLLANQTLSGTVQGLVFLNEEFELAGDATSPIGVATKSISITYTK